MIIGRSKLYTVLLLTRAPTCMLCDVGCIGCKKCEKACEYGAVKVTDFCATVSPDLCTNCGKCVEACPQHCITYFKA